MDFFNLPSNLFWGQFISGAFAGLCLGSLVPSEYEKQTPYQDRKFVWKWKKYDQPITVFSVIKYMLFLILCITIGGFIIRQIYLFFGCYPITKEQRMLFTFVFFLTAFLAKYIRYLYFKKRLYY